MDNPNDYLVNPKDLPLGFFNKTPEIEVPESFEFDAKSLFNSDIKEQDFFNSSILPFLKKETNKLDIKYNVQTQNKETKEDKEDKSDFLKIYDIEPQNEPGSGVTSTLEENINKYKTNQDQQALAEIIKELNPIIERGIQIFGGGNQALIGQAKILVKNAIDSYDPSKGDLKTHVLLHLQRLRRLNPQTDNIISVSEGMKMLAIQLAEAEKELTDKLGRPPSDQELADYMKISLAKLKKIRAAQGGVAESNVEGMAVESPESDEDQEQARELWIQAIYVDLDPTEQYILDSVYGRNGRQKKTLQQLSEELKLPVSTIHAKLKKIENTINLVTTAS